MEDKNAKLKVNLNIPIKLVLNGIDPYCTTYLW